MKIILYILLFIVLSTINLEYLINRQSSTALLVLAVIIELGLIYIFIFQQLKKIFK